MKLRSTPHPEMTNSALIEEFHLPAAAPDYSLFPAQYADQVNIDELFGKIGWGRTYLSKHGHEFQIQSAGQPNDEQMNNWLSIEKDLDKYISAALEALIPPLENPSEFDANGLRLECVYLEKDNSFILEFDSDYCKVYHEVFWAYFKNFALEKVDWVT